MTPPAWIAYAAKTLEREQGRRPCPEWAHPDPPAIFIGGGYQDPEICMSCCQLLDRHGKLLTIEEAEDANDALILAEAAERYADLDWRTFKKLSR